MPDDFHPFRTAARRDEYLASTTSVLDAGRSRVLGDLEQSADARKALYEEAKALAEQNEVVGLHAALLLRLGSVALSQGDPATAERLMQDALSE